MAVMNEVGVCNAGALHATAASERPDGAGMKACPAGDRC